MAAADASAIGPVPAPGGEPLLLPREQHSISRRDIDPDALKILFRLQRLGFTAYLTGGAVRDMLLGRKPKDFDIATDARPNQIRKYFANAFIIGRRFRLAHIRFRGGKVIEVATFRRDPGPPPAGGEGRWSASGRAHSARPPPLPRPSGSSGSRSASARSSPTAPSTSRSGRRASTPSSARTAPASRP